MAVSWEGRLGYRNPFMEVVMYKTVQGRRLCMTPATLFREAHKSVGDPDRLFLARNFLSLKLLGIMIKRLL